MQKVTVILILLLCSCFSWATTQANIGKKLFESRCAMCHGDDAKATGPLAKKSNPPTPDLTSCAFQEKLVKFPGVIVSSIVLRPNQALLSKTLKENNVVLPHKQWTDDDLRALNQYMLTLIYEHPCFR